MVIRSKAARGANANAGAWRGLAVTVAAAAALQGIGATTAWAEDADNDSNTVERIEVTGLKARRAAAGTKTETALIETPQSITVIDGDELSRRNVQSINQALGFVAGVSPNQRGGMVTRYDQLVVRGFAPGVELP